MNSLVSVVIPTYNRPKLLKRALNSVHKQTYSNIEVIVVDDNSSTDIRSVVKNTNIGDIVYKKHKKNRGGGAARNTGIEAASGEYIAFLDSDDTWKPTKIEQQVENLEKMAAEFAAIYCLRYHRQGEMTCLREVENDIKTGDIQADLLSGWMQTVTSELLIDTDCLKELNGFDTNLESFQEYDLLVRLSEDYKIACVRDHLIVKHHGDFDRISENPSKRLNGLNTFISKHREKIEENIGIKEFKRTRMPKIYQLYAIRSCVERNILSSFKYILKWRNSIGGLDIRHYVLILLVIINGENGYKLAKDIWYLFQCWDH